MTPTKTLVSSGIGSLQGARKPDSNPPLNLAGGVLSVQVGLEDEDVADVERVEEVTDAVLLLTVLSVVGRLASEAVFGWLVEERCEVVAVFAELLLDFVAAGAVLDVLGNVIDLEELDSSEEELNVGADRDVEVVVV